MFDFTLTTRPTSFDNSPFIRNSKCHKFCYYPVGFNIECFSYFNEDEFYAEDRDYFILIQGIMFRGNYSNSPYSRLYACDLLKDIVPTINNLHKLRGNFSLLIIVKKQRKLYLANDLFGLSPIYYSLSAKSLVISSNLYLISSGCEIDHEVLMEKFIFEHSLTDSTIVKGVKRLPVASKLHYSFIQFDIETYFNWKEFFLSAGDKPFRKREFTALFNDLIASRSDSDNQNLVTLTAGHDGRAVLSSFIHQSIPVKSFSFGRPGSVNTSIPLGISQKLGFDYQPAYLTEEFTDSYFQNAIQTLLLSDGELTFEQQSTIYASMQFEKQHDIVYSGLLAGEILGPMRHVRNYMNINYYRTVILDESFDPKAILDNSSYSNLLDYSKIHDSIIEKLKQRRAYLKDFNNPNVQHLKYMHQLVTYGFKYFYGAQIHQQRYNMTNIPVFYDFDLFSMLINTNFHHCYKHNFKGIYRRRNARAIQSYIIEKNSKALSKVSVELGYPPFFLNRFYLKGVIPILYYLRKRVERNNPKPKDFISEIWSSGIYKKEFFSQVMEVPGFSKKHIEEYLESLSGHPENYNYDKNRIISLFIYNYLIINRIS